MPTIRVLDIIDIFIVTVLIYQLLLLIRGTRAVQLVTGVVILILAYAISRAVGLYTLQFVLQYLGVVIPIALLVIFQPELRRMLEQLGRGGVLVSGLAPHTLGREEIIRLVNDVSRAARILGLRKIGALIVLERRTGLADFIETGIKVDAVVTVQLLISLFFPNSPLHDGAAIIRGNRVVAACCPCLRIQWWPERWGRGTAPGWGLPSRPMRWRLSCRRRRGPSRWPARGSSS